MNNTSLFDLNQTAANAAISALGKDALGTESIMLESFDAAGHDRADFSQWKGYYENHVRNYTQLKATPSPAAKAAQQAEAVATAAAKTAAANANKTQTAAATPAAA